MRKYLFLISLFCLCISLSAQSYNRRQQNVSSGSAIGFDKSRLTFGGGFGLQFGSYTLISIAPKIGYNFSEKFNAGAGISYTYYKDDFHSNGEKWDQKRHYAGFNLHARFFPVQYIVLSAQPEANRMWLTESPKGAGQSYSENKFVPSFIVGAGVRLGPITAMLQYDVAQNKHSPYGDNIFYSIEYIWGF